MANYYGKFYLDDWMRDLVDEETWSDGSKHKFVRINVVELPTPRVNGNFTTTHFIGSGEKREKREEVMNKTGRKNLVFGDLTLSNYGNQPIAKNVDKNTEPQDDGLPF